jgi:hypothetical protein
MQKFARVFFKMNAVYANPLGFAIYFNIKIAAFADRRLILGYLIIFWEIGVKILFAGKNRAPVNAAI